MENNRKRIEFEDLIAFCHTYLSSEDVYIKLKEAYELIVEKHANQLRKSGEPYIYHLLEVAYTLAKLHTGPNTIIAGLLHDIIEDCAVSEEEITNRFSEDICSLVVAVTKVNRLSQMNITDYQAENHRKIFIAMARDIRVIIIKLCDRLHNMRTLMYMEKNKQIIISKETLEIYTPIAHRLGINSIKSELEDLCLLYLEPEKYHHIEQLLSLKQTERDQNIERLSNNISKILTDNNLPFQISGRSKSIYSVYKKMYLKDRIFEEIYDLQALRIVTQTKMNCYEILGYIHDAYRPIPGRFKDYIAMPKPNMYQSLHTTVVADDGKIFEIQIRTNEMDEIANIGVAAHWRYKENKEYDLKQEQREIEEKLHWFKDLISISDENTDANAKEYMDALTKDIFEANVYVMTPKGRVIDLPNGSTPIDFAYKVHTQVGHTMIGALVNGTMVPLSQTLKTGDVVEIKTNKNTGPSEDWLKIAKTNSAINHIKKYLIKLNSLENRDDAIAKGKELFSLAVKEDGLTLNEAVKFLEDEKYKKIRIYETMNDLYYAIGNRHVGASNIVSKILTETRLRDKIAATTSQILNSKATVSKMSSANNDLGIIVEGVDNVAICMAQCCAPIPGDVIVGYISKGLGIKIHRHDCPNINGQEKRLINVFWDTSSLISTAKYIAYVQVTSIDRPNLLLDLMNTFSQAKITMQSIKGMVNDKNSVAKFNIIIKVRDSNHLSEVFNLVNNLAGIVSIERICKN